VSAVVVVLLMFAAVIVMVNKVEGEQERHADIETTDSTRA
jgi:hypothetical protein